MFTGFARSMVMGHTADSAPATSNKTIGNKQSRQPHSHKNPKTFCQQREKGLGCCISTAIGLLYSDVKAAFGIHALKTNKQLSFHQTFTENRVQC